MELSWVESAGDRLWSVIVGMTTLDWDKDAPVVLLGESIRQRLTGAHQQSRSRSIWLKFAGHDIAIAGKPAMSPC